MSCDILISRPIVVGKIKSRNPKNNQPILWSYFHVNFDEHGWASVENFLPHEYDLCHLKTDDNQSLRGWHTSQIWDGLNISEKTKIKFWKRFDEKE